MPQGTLRLSPKQRKLVQYLTQGMTVTAAALKAGYSAKSPGQAGYQALKTVRLKIPDIMDKQGLSDQKLVKKYLQPALEASTTRYVVVGRKGKERIEEYEDIAWDARLRALDMAFKLKGSYAPVEQQLQHVHEITLMEKESARRTIEKIRALESDSKTPLLAEPTEE
jgi:phage terminase small subunit